MWALPSSELWVSDVPTTGFLDAGWTGRPQNGTGLDESAPEVVLEIGRPSGRHVHLVRVSISRQSRTRRTKKMNIALTGGNGYVGSHVLAELHSRTVTR